MGSGASASASEIPGGDLRLPATGLKFSVNQLHSLNSHVETLFDEDQKAGISVEVESAVESLVQRIVDGAGQRDPRFRCCHLIALHRGKKMRSRSLEYLVTLDSLPPLNSGNEDCRLQPGPVGFGKIRLAGREAERWQEFLTPSGYLSRDKVIERWVALLARCTQPRGGGSSRVLCARAATRTAPYHYCYIQKSSPTQPSDTRLAIVEGTTWVLVRCGAAQAEAKLILGARVQGCDPAAYTFRVPLTDPMAMLHYTAAQGGYYAVAIGPPSSISLSDRPGTWQLWHPALEATLDNHCADASAAGRLAGALNVLIDKMRDGHFEGRLRAVSRYSVASLLRARLSRSSYSRTAAKCCSTAHMSHHLLLVLDTIVSVCERGLPPGFNYPLSRSALSRRGATDELWREDAASVRSCLMHLLSIAGNEEIPPTPAEALEMAMFARWDNLTRESKAGTSLPTYSQRQLLYVWRVARELVKCKEMVVYENHSVFKANLIQATSTNDEDLEQLVHITAIMLDQARDLYLNNCQMNNGEFSRDLSNYRSKKWKKLRDYYDASSSCLIDAIRRDPDLRNSDLTDQITFTKTILDWLYKGAKEDKKYLGPVLKKYLENLFLSSLENCWFLEEFDSKRSEKDMEGLKEYCMGVHDGKVDPCLGLMDAAKKMPWAKTVVDFVDRFRHVEFRLIFPTGDGLAISYVIKLPSRRDNKESRTLTLNRRDKAEAKTRLAKRAVVSAFTDVICGYRGSKPKLITRHESSDEILASVKSGQYWKNSKPDIIANTNSLDKDFTRTKRRSRRNRPMTSHGFPEISVSKESDAKTMRRKYHTLRSLVYTDGGEGLKESRRRPRSAGSTVRSKEPMSRPSILETLDFINSVKDALYVEESGTSDIEESWSGEEDHLISLSAPLNSIARGTNGDCTHWALGSHVLAALHRGSFSMLQELCAWLGESSEGALFALHRLARTARSRSTERISSTWKLSSPEDIGSPQRYKPRPLDYMSGDDAPQPPPLPRLSSKDTVSKRYSSYIPPNRLEELEHHLTQLESIQNKLNLAESNQSLFNQSKFNQTQLNQSQFNLNQNYTGIINPIYDIKLPKSKFSVKRSKSLGRNDSVKSIDMSRYNLTLGFKSGKTNDVITAISEMTAETGLDVKGNFFQRYSTAEVVGDAYRVSRATIE